MNPAFFLLAALAATLVEGAPVSRDAMIRDATDRLLAGEALPRDMDEQLMRLAPSDRIEVLIFLRRSGLLIGPGWPVERLLAPAKPEGPSK